MSKSRKFRSKLSFAEDEDEGQPVVLAPAAKAPSKPSLLSFGDDEDGMAGPSAGKKKKDKSKSKFQRSTAATPSDGPAAAATHRPGAGGCQLLITLVMSGR